MKKTKQVIYLDMDGTIADLYGVENWLEKLRNEESGLFSSLSPMITEEELFQLYPETEHEFRILSMTPKGASERYVEQVKHEKDLWLSKHFPKIREGKRIYMKFGNNKNLKGSKNTILIDDNENIRNNFKGLALHPVWA